MAYVRKVSTTFKGSTSKQTDPGAWTDKAIVANAVGDTALVHDQLTNQNSPSVTIDHTGSGAGVPLGVSLGCNAVVVADGGGGASAVASRPNSYSTVTHNRAFLFMTPIYLPEGETAIRMSININDPDGLRIACKNTSWADTGNLGDGSVNNLWTGGVDGLTGGNIYFIGIECELGTLPPTRWWSGMSIYFPSTANEHYQTPAWQSDANWAQSPVASQAGASSSTIVDQTDWDTLDFAQDAAIHAQTLDRLNKNQNALAEFMSGSPAGGNAAYTLVPSSGADPASGAFHDHSLSTYGNEEEIDFPIIAVPMGATGAGDTDSTYATDNWGAPAVTTGSEAIFANDGIIMPDFVDGTTSSRLKCVVLFTDGSATGVNQGKELQTLRAQTIDAGGANQVDNTDATNPITWMGSTDWGYATLGGSGGNNRLDFGGGEFNRLQISIEDTRFDTVANALRIVGYCWFFDRDG